MTVEESGNWIACKHLTAVVLQTFYNETYKYGFEFTVLQNIIIGSFKFRVL